MEDDKKPKPEGTPTGDDELGTNAEFIEQIKKLKRETVPLDKYNALAAEKAELIKALANGDPTEVHDDPKNEPTLNDLRKKIVDPDLSNLEYAETALKLRDSVIKGGGRDPFLGIGQQYDTVVERDREQTIADNVARVIQQCIDDADGDSNTFTALLQSHMINTIKKK